MASHARRFPRSIASALVAVPLLLLLPPWAGPPGAAAQDLPGLGAAPGGAQDPEPEAPAPGGSSGVVAVEGLNVGLGRADAPPDLETPQAALESYIDACEAGDWARAARCLDLNGLEPGRQAEAGPVLARKLKSVMDHQVWFKW